MAIGKLFSCQKLDLAAGPAKKRFCIGEGDDREKAIFFFEIVYLIMKILSHVCHFVL